MITVFSAMRPFIGSIGQVQLSAIQSWLSLGPECQVVLVDDEEGAAFVGRTDESDEDPGNSVVTPRRMHGSWAARCRLYGDRAWIEDVMRTVKESVFARSADDKNRLESRQQVRIVGNLMTLAGSLEFQV